MSTKVDHGLISILRNEIADVIANRHMDKADKEAKIKELHAQIEQEQNKSVRLKTVNRPNCYIGYIRMNYPEVFEKATEAINQNRLYDLSLIKPVYRSLYDSIENPRENMHFILAVIIELFEPTRRTCGIKFRPGLRDKIAEAMGYVNPEMFNYFAKPIEVHMKNPRYFNKVIDTAKEYLNALK